MKYTIRKLLTLLFVATLFFGPGVFRAVRDIVAPSPEIRIARALEEYESNWDVVYIEPYRVEEGKEVTEEDLGRVVIVVVLDNKNYWLSGSTRKWENTVAFTLKIIKENGYEKLSLYSGIVLGEIAFESRCDTTRITDCVYRSFTAESPTPWLGKGKP